MVATYIIGALKRSPSEVKEMVKHLKNNKGKFMSTLEMLLKEGEEIGVKKGKLIGIKEGEQIGVKKGELIGIKKGTTLKALITLLKVLDKFPHWKINEIVQFTEIKKESIVTLQTVLATKKKRAIQKVIKEQLLSGILLSRVEQAKINRLVDMLLKKK